VTRLPLAKRIIPCLDVKAGRVVKGVHFKGLRDAGDPVELAIRYREEGADEIVFLDITASIQRRKTLRTLVRQVAANLDIPFTVGGGIRSMSDARLILCNGADKVSINTAAIQHPQLIRKLANVFGSQCVVVAIDAKRSKVRDGWKFMIYSHSATKPTQLEAGRWSRTVERLGAGELLVTSIDRDGTKLGYDLELLQHVTAHANLPIIASGGCGSLAHFRSVFSETHCDAALAASLFHYGELSIKEVKDYLIENRILVRP
jgi:cyclase